MGAGSLMKTGINKGLFSNLPLGMNRRNYLIRRSNPRASLRLADDKLAFKHLVEANGIAAPRTYQVIHDFTDMPLISTFPNEFVIKPNSSYGGHGIMLLEREGDSFVDPSGDIFAEKEVRRHVRKILDGEYSGFTEADQVIVEERIYPSLKLDFGALIGLPDVRVWCFGAVPVMAMLRYPTRESHGKGNLSQGALGMSIELESGKITYVHIKVGQKELTPAEVNVPPDYVVPKWNEIRELGARCAGLSGLGLSGVDLVLDRNDNVLVLEINGHPGLEIQNVNEASLLTPIRRLTAGSGR